MRSSLFGQAVLMLLLLAGGVVLWRASGYELRVAAAERGLVTLHYDTAASIAAEPSSRIARLMPGEAATTAQAKNVAATAGYWQSDYTALTADPDEKLLAANAAYRTLRREGGTWQAVVGKLDTLIKNYAEVLRAQPDQTDAAFNYEYAIRLRSLVAARKQAVAPYESMGSDLTIHGATGAPPTESDTKKFKMIVPMRPDERLEAERAGKGATKVRKG